jgi:hypothetical protein
MRFIGEFPRNSSKKSGIEYLCKYCRRDYDKAREIEKPLYKRDCYLRRNYGFTHDQYVEMYNSQNGQCSICNDYYPQLCMDHCHSTGRVRGLLCNPCNKGLGHFRDNPIFLKSAIDYLLN